MKEFYCFSTDPRQEDRAASFLASTGVETFTPRILVKKQYLYVARTCVQHLFPGYIFGRCQLAEVVHRLKETWTVREIVGIAGEPSIVALSVIEEIRSRMDESGLVRLDDETGPDDDLKPEQPIEVTHGPFFGRSGIFLRSTSSRDRIVILLNLLGAAPVEINREHVRPAQVMA